MPRIETSLSRVLPGPKELVWGLVSDTNRWDRALGLSAATYRWEERSGRRVRVARTRELGFDIEWIEPPYEWLEGRFVEGARSFSAGPVDHAGMRVRLADDPRGTHVTATVFITAPPVVAWTVGPVLRMRFRLRLAQYLAALIETLSNKSLFLSGSGPPTVQTRRALQSANEPPIVAGDHSPYDARELALRERRLREAGVSDVLVSKLTSLLKERPDEELSELRPYELATIWEMPREEVLRAFMHATRAGLLDMRWQVLCPVCQVAAQVAQSLSDVQRNVHCEACNVDYDVDFGERVEAVFQSNPAVRRAKTALYCASSPTFLPHVIAKISVDGQDVREELGDLPPGLLRIRADASAASIDVHVTEDQPLVEVTVSEDGTVAATTRSAEAPSVRVLNRAATPRIVLVERTDWRTNAALGSVIASSADFIDLFATEAPASGVELSVSHLAVLFTDLTGSTALYERIGDARAFAKVEEHFRTMDRVVRAHDGALIKTMGDAVMATFVSAAQAVAAAIDMIHAHGTDHDVLGLGVKIGVHAGPCLAVRANDRLDFFGTTVNLAARLQAKAESGQLVLTETVAQEPAVVSLLEGMSSNTFASGLKGITGVRTLVAFNIS